ncbi:hypothetical protein HDE_13618 [Halotydeus destructor]|nr:hypothetical protein HDE_13618 [Halotydeus destructor]
MLPSLVLCLIALTTVSSGPVKRHMVKAITYNGREFFWFGSTVTMTFSETEQLCALYGAEMAEPDHWMRRNLQVNFAPSYWLNCYYDVDTSMWRWISDHLPIDLIETNWDTNQPACRGADCANWRLAVVKERYAQLVTIDERLGTKLPVICERAQIGYN